MQSTITRVVMPIVVSLLAIGCGSPAGPATAPSQAPMTTPAPSPPTAAPSAVVTPSLTPDAAAQPVWTASGSLHEARTGFTATLLADGRVLVVGGMDPAETEFPPTHLSSAELYDPTTGIWTRTGSMAVGRIGHSATLLPNGQVLVAGGPDFEAAQAAEVEIMGRISAELYDPATGEWTATGSMTTGRGGHSATLLTNGTVLVAGGGYSDDVAARSAELYDPGSGRWTATSSMGVSRFGHSAVMLPNEGVLVVAGVSLGSDPVPLSSAEVYDPIDERWTSTGSLATEEFGTIATRLLDGTVLATRGGLDGATTVERYDPSTGRWTSMAALPEARSGFTATLLPDGSVLAVGGGHRGDDGGCCVSVSTVERYDHETDEWTVTPSLIEARRGHVALVLYDGRVLVVGGTGESGDLKSAELYGPPRP